MNDLESRIAEAICLSVQADVQQEADCRREAMASAVAAGLVPHYSFGGKVVRVHDGDTLIVQGPDGWPEWWSVVAIRLAGIDAPEIHDKRKDLAELASKARAELLKMTPVGLKVLFDGVRPDKYGGRLLATPIVSGLDCCEELLRLGLARPYDGHGPKPWGVVKQ